MSNVYSVVQYCNRYISQENYQKVKSLKDTLCKIKFDLIKRSGNNSNKGSPVINVEGASSTVTNETASPSQTMDEAGDVRSQSPKFESQQIKENFLAVRKKMIIHSSIVALKEQSIGDNAKEDEMDNIEENKKRLECIYEEDATSDQDTSPSSGQSSMSSGEYSVDSLRLHNTNFTASNNYDSIGGIANEEEHEITTPNSDKEQALVQAELKETKEPMEGEMSKHKNIKELSGTQRNSLPLEEQLNSAKQELVKKTEELKNKEGQLEEMERELNNANQALTKKTKELESMQAQSTENKQRIDNLTREKNRLIEEKELSLGDKNKKFSAASVQIRRQGNYTSASFILSGIFAVGTSLTRPYNLAICVTLGVVAVASLTAGLYCSYKANTTLNNVKVDRQNNLEVV